MFRAWVFLLWLGWLGGGLPLSAHSPGTQRSGVRLDIIRFTGQIQIQTDDTRREQKLQGMLPHIPAGSEVSIVAGEALFQSGDLFVFAESGDSFLFNTAFPRDGGPEAVIIAGTGKETTLDVELGAIRAILHSGAAIAIQRFPSGKGRLESVVGDILVSVPGSIKNIKPGAYVESELPPRASLARPSLRDALKDDKETGPKDREKAGPIGPAPAASGVAK